MVTVNKDKTSPRCSEKQENSEEYIIVSSRIIRDFLVQNGVKMRGRNFQLIDCTKNSY